MESSMRLFPLPLFLALAAACTDGGKGGTDDTAIGSDSGDSGHVDLGPPGCINLNGEEGDFDTITDALVYAVGGDTVNVCAGNYSEHVVVDGGIHIVGESAETTAIDAPVNEPAFELSGDGASVSGFTITSTRSGVTAEGGDGITLTDIVFDNVANYGVEASEATNLKVSACTFTAPAYGGVFLSGGSATVEASLFTEPQSYGIWATGDATLTANDNIFDQVHATTTDGTDGHAIFGDGGVVSMSHNVVTTDDLIGIWVAGGVLSMNGDLIADTPYAVLAFDSSFTAEGVEIYGAQAQGMYIASPSDPVSIVDSVVALNGGNTTGLTSCSEDYAVWGGFCGGILVAADTASISGTTVSDYENYGVYSVPYKSAHTQALSIQNLTLDNNGRWSLYVNSAEATVDGLIVTNHREPDTTNTEPCYGYVDRGDAAVFEQTDATVTNTTITDSEGWGIAFVLGTGELTNSTIARNQCAGVMNFEGSLVATGNDFSEPKDYGSIFNYQGAFVLTNSTFHDSHYLNEYSYDDGTGTGGYYRYTYTGGGWDVISNGATGCAISGNTFTDGDASLELELAGCEVSDNTWTGYDNYVVYVYEGDESDPVVIDGNTVEDVGGPVIYNVYGYAEVKDLTVGTTRAYTYAYESYHGDADGVETLNYSYSYDQTQPTIYSYGYYYAYRVDNDGDGIAETLVESGMPASMSIENVSVNTSANNLLYAQESALDIRDLSAETVGGYGVYATWSHYAPQVELDGLQIGSATSTAVNLDANSLDAGYALLSNIAVDVSESAGMYISGVSEIEVTDAEFLDSSTYGVSIDGSVSNYDSITGTYTYLTLDYTAALSGVVVGSATSDGILITNGTVDLSDSEATGGGAAGLTLSSTTASVTSNVFSTNATYGMVCSDTTLTACSGNALDGNTSGAHLACSDDCSL